jgi:hypothetical protein
MLRCVVSDVSKDHIDSKILGTVYPATQGTRPEYMHLQAFCITCIVIFYDDAVFQTVWLLPVFLLKTFPLVLHAVNDVHILLNCGR